MKQGGLLFPKEPARKKRKKHHKSIIDRDMKNQCFICGKTGYTERHHIPMRYNYSWKTGNTPLPDTQNYI